MVSLRRFGPLPPVSLSLVKVRLVYEKDLTAGRHIEGTQSMEPVEVATPLGFEPRITPPKGAVLPLHHGVCAFGILDRRFSVQVQCPKFKG